MKENQSKAKKEEGEGKEMEIHLFVKNEISAMISQKKQLDQFNKDLSQYYFHFVCSSFPTLSFDERLFLSQSNLSSLIPPQQKQNSLSSPYLFKSHFKSTSNDNNNINHNITQNSTVNNQFSSFHASSPFQRQTSPPRIIPQTPISSTISGASYLENFLETLVIFFLIVTFFFFNLFFSYFFF